MSDPEDNVIHLAKHRPQPSGRDMNWRPCPTCEGQMRFTGLPDFSGPIYYRIYKCARCGFVRQDVEE